MKSRVTITLDPAVHQFAKQIARKKKTTLSGLIESLLQSEKSPNSDHIVDGMLGSASLRASAPGSDPLYDTLKAKYIR